MSGSQSRAPRADGRRSRAAILDAAVRLLNDDPETRLEAIATAAGVTRQTVYAHFPSREVLLAAVVARVTEEVVAAMDATETEAGTAAEALLRLLEASTAAVNRYPVLREALSRTPAPAAEERRLHAPITERITAVVARGQRDGEFDVALPAHWYATVTVGLAHAAAHEVLAGRMAEDESRAAMRHTLLRTLRAS